MIPNNLKIYERRDGVGVGAQPSSAQGEWKEEMKPPPEITSKKQVSEITGSTVLHPVCMFLDKYRSLLKGPICPEV